MGLPPLHRIGACFFGTPQVGYHAALSHQGREIARKLGEVPTGTSVVEIVTDNLPDMAFEERRVSDLDEIIRGAAGRRWQVIQGETRLLRPSATSLVWTLTLIAGAAVLLMIVSPADFFILRNSPPGFRGSPSP